MDENEIGGVVVGTALSIHRQLGPGLLETVYEIVLARALTVAGLVVERQVAIPITYDEICYDEAFRADIVVNGLVIIESKSVETLRPVHKKQLLTYLRLAEMKLGFLLNFGDCLMKNGIVRIVNGLPES